MARLYRGHADAARDSRDDVVRITTAPESPQADLSHRQKRYVISMTIRTACFVLGIIVGTVLHIVWLMWVLIAASFFLPYVAVVMANSASPRIEGPDLGGIRHDELQAPRPAQQPPEEPRDR